MKTRREQESLRYKKAENHGFGLFYKKASAGQHGSQQSFRSKTSEVSNTVGNASQANLLLSL